jgi:hypothetical protein
MRRAASSLPTRSGTIAAWLLRLELLRSPENQVVILLLGMSGCGCGPIGGGYGRYRCSTTTYSY